MDAGDLSEAQLTSHLDEFLGQLKLNIIARQVSIGKFRLDALACDANGSIVIVELKVVTTKDTLGQLLIYPHVLEKLLAQGGASGTKVRSVLITTNLDINVVEIAERLGPLADISLKVCIGSLETGLKLVDPHAGGNHVWDQSKEGNRHDIRVVDGKLVVRGSIAARDQLREVID